MLKRDVLVPITKQETGRLLKKYLHTAKLKPAPATPASPILEISSEETKIMPSVERQWLPRFIHYRAVNGVMELLYSAILNSISELGSVPDMLYISRTRSKELWKQFHTIQEIEFDGYFRFYRGGALYRIPVMTGEMLPDLIANKLVEDIKRDEVIAIVTGAPTQRIRA